VADKISVLIVDDITSTLDNLKKLLSFEPDIDVVAVASNGREAVDEGKRLHPDVVLMDVNMPEMDGIQATEILASEAPNSPVIIMSVQGERDYLRRAMQSGAREFLIKPFSGDELIASIRRVHQLEQRKETYNRPDEGAPATAATAPAARPAPARPRPAAPRPPARPAPTGAAPKSAEQAAVPERRPEAPPEPASDAAPTVAPDVAPPVAVPPAAAPPPEATPPEPPATEAETLAPAPPVEPAPAEPEISAPAAPAETADPVAVEVAPEIALEPAEAPEEAPPEPEAPPVPRRDVDGEIIVLYGSKGGVGKSVLATNLACSLSREVGARVALVDLDLQFGDIAVLLNLPQSQSIIDLIDNAGQLDPEFVRDMLAIGPADVRVLPTAPSPELADLVTPEHAQVILGMLKKLFDFVVVDTSSHLGDVTLAALDMASRIVLVSALSIPAVKDAKLALRLFDTLSIPTGNVMLVLNRCEAHTEFNKESIESNLKFPVSVQLPHDPRTVINSINRGIPFVVTNPEAEASQRVRELVHLLLPQGVAVAAVGAPAAAARPRRRFGRR